MVNFISYFDHVILAASTLEAGTHYLKEATGASACYGGRHPGRGTCNALAALENKSYVEILAPDTPKADGSQIVSYLKQLTHPTLAWWCVRCDELEIAAQSLKRANIGDPLVVHAQRTAPDGKTLSWQLLFLREPRLGASAPFLIDWGDTAHPSESAPDLGQLTSFAIHHPHASLMQDCLNAIGYTDPNEIMESETPQMRATFMTADKGKVHLNGDLSNAPALE